MRFNAVGFTKVMCAIAPTLIITLPYTAKADIPIERLTGSTRSSLPTSALVGSSELTLIRPSTHKRWTPSPVTARSVPTFWSASPQPSLVVNHRPAALPTLTSSPLLTTQALEEANSQLFNGSVTQLEGELTEKEPAVEELQEREPTTEDSEAVQVEVDIVQSIPSLEEIQQIQRDLRGLDIPESTRSRRSVYPGITISNPSGYGADGGQVYAGIGYQSRTRFSGGNTFSGGVRDGTAGIGFGLGNARESIGLQLSYTAASFGGSRAPFSGGFNAKLHKQFGQGWAVAIGGEGIVNFGRLPGDGEVEFNDFEGTYYGVVTKTISLREDFYQPFSRLTLTGGAGSGRFRSVDQIANDDFAIGVFGSAALQVFPSTSLITEWTGQDLAVGVSIAPFPHFPIVFTPAIRDLAGEGDGTPRFVLGVGVSLSEIFSRLGL